eukprot:TRINITY_DN25843_c0_g1_i1.p1 TRINITY_DN25843_c0_g1~~TRINITY_DN25843_c0_g1_i1.p1  ORF type:complete len:522 (+),score=110.07 TRINITY_DN25843_c0_g1_i1:27-1568(+)
MGGVWGAMRRGRADIRPALAAAYALVGAAVAGSFAVYSQMSAASGPPQPPGAGRLAEVASENARLQHTVAQLKAQLSAAQRAPTAITDPDSTFRFHVYPIPDKYIAGAMRELKRNWDRSVCNRDVKRKTNYTLLDWRHAHSLFTVDTFIARYLRFHPRHTPDPAQADVFIVPAMTHLYNCAMHMEWLVEIVQWVAGYSEYHRIYDNHDHYMFWWRWGMNHRGTLKFFSALMRTLPNVNWISYEFLELMGRNEYQDFSLALKPRFKEAQHGIVLPYPDFSPKLQVPVADPHAPREHFAFMAGTSTIGGVRRWIKRELNRYAGDAQTPCLYQEFATDVVDPRRLGVPTEYPDFFRNSLFCVHAAGDGLSSRRPTSAVLAGCIPVLVCDLCLYAFENLLNYSSFAVFVKEDDVMAGRMVSQLRAIPREEIRRKQQALVEVRQHFTYNTEGPPRAGDALDLLVKQLSLRGSILRSYRRWWQSNRHLSSHMRDYPRDPPKVNRYKVDLKDDPTVARRR